MQSSTGSASSANALPSGGYGSSLSQIFSGKYPTYEVGIQLTLPLRNRVAKADLTRDLLQKRAYQTQLVQLQNQAVLEIDTAVIGLGRAVGTLLDENRISIDEAYRGYVSKQPSAPGAAPPK